MRRKNYDFKIDYDVAEISEDYGWSCDDPIMGLCDRVMRMYLTYPKNAEKLVITLSDEHLQTDSIAIKPRKHLEIPDDIYLKVDGVVEMFNPALVREVATMMKEWQTDTVYATVFYWG